MFFKRKPKILNIVLVDDSEGSLLILDDFISTYFEKKDIEYSIDTFKCFDDFKQNKKDKYDIAIVDWNLSNSFNDRGDRVINELNCKNISIFSGMSEDAAKITFFAIKNNNIHYIKKGDLNYVDKLNQFFTNSI